MEPVRAHTKQQLNLRQARVERSIRWKVTVLLWTHHQQTVDWLLRVIISRIVPLGLSFYLAEGFLKKNKSKAGGKQRAEEGTL
ncbi:hypothetical protein Q5P01_015973 [Channa striata]|uniref:Uncharacterized protein n=1 Tax=Channa striata TaxID=64152 RepID=A0AA88MEB4_CHASR|nr:hypothetical protein Q5P01_015973 [Channa striata]